MPKIRGIFDHAKPRNASSYNSRASRRRLAASAPSLPASPRVPAPRLHKRLAPEMHKGRP